MVAVLMALWGASSGRSHRRSNIALSRRPVGCTDRRGPQFVRIYLGIAAGTAIGSIGISTGVTMTTAWGAALAFMALVYAAGTSRW